MRRGQSGFAMKAMKEPAHKSGCQQRQRGNCRVLQNQITLTRVFQLAQEAAAGQTEGLTKMQKKKANRLRGIMDIMF